MLEFPTDLIIEGHLRPFKVAFLIDINQPLSIIDEMVEYNTFIWGGKYNIAVPTSNEIIDENHWKLLENYLPDKVFLCGEFSDEFRNDLINRLNLFCCHTWSSEILQLIKEYSYRVLQPGISTIQILDKKFKYANFTKSSNVLYPIFDISDTEKNSYYYQYLFKLGKDDGLNSESYKYIVSHLKGTEYKIQNEQLNFKDFNTFKQNYKKEEKLSLLDLSGENLKLDKMSIDLFNSLDYRIHSNIEHIFLFNKNIYDLTVLWNLRNYTSSMKIYFIDEMNSFLAIKEYIEKQQSKEFYSFIIPSFNKNEALEFLKKINGLNIDHLKRISVEYNNYYRFLPKNILYYIKDFTDKQRIENNNFFLSIPRIDEIQFYNDEGLIYDINVFNTRTKRYLAFFKDLESNNSDYRFKETYLSILVNKKTTLINIEIPNFDALIKKRLRLNNIKFDINHKKKMLRTLLNLLEGDKFIKLLRNKVYRDFFHKMKKENLTANEISSKVKDSKFIKNNLSFLLKNNIFFRGLNLTCDTCNLKSWYSIKDFNNEFVECSGCKSYFQIESFPEPKFAFKQNELINKLINEGYIGILLSLNLLRNISDKYFYYTSDIILIDNNGNYLTDLDLICYCNGKIVFLESKDIVDKEQSLKLNWQENKNQFDKLVSIGTKAKVDLVLWSTTLQESDIDNDFLNHNFNIIRQRPSNQTPRNILFGSELEKGYVEDEKNKPIFLLDNLIFQENQEYLVSFDFINEAKIRLAAYYLHLKEPNTSPEKNWFKAKQEIFTMKNSNYPLDNA